MPVTINQKGKSTKQMKANYQRAIQTTSPQKVKVMALEWFNNSFVLQGFTDQSFQPWRPRKKEQRRLYFGKTAKLKKSDPARRGILVKSATLRRTGKGKVQGNAITISYGEGIKYAQIHNDGGMAGRNHAAKIPRRRFIGQSRMLENEINKMATNEINKALR